MKLRTPLLLFALGLVPATLLLCAAHSPKDPREEQVARGQYLVTYGGCGDCHTPRRMGSNGPEPDMNRFLAGHPQDAELPAPPKVGTGPWFATSFTAWAGPWGISYAPNLTPDKNTGMGIWTRQMFIKAMRTGKHYGVGRPILPPMPWQSLAELTDEDLIAVYEYLRTVTPVRNAVPDPVPPSGKTS